MLIVTKFAYGFQACEGCVIIYELLICANIYSCLLMQQKIILI